MLKQFRLKRNKKKKTVFYSLHFLYNLYVPFWCVYTFSVRYVVFFFNHRIVCFTEPKPGRIDRNIHQDVQKEEQNLQQHQQEHVDSSTQPRIADDDVPLEGITVIPHGKGKLSANRTCHSNTFAIFCLLFCSLFSPSHLFFFSPGFGFGEQLLTCGLQIFADRKQRDFHTVK